MNSVPKEVLLEAALDAYAAGLCVVPAKSDGTKAPVGQWKQWQTERPNEDLLRRWFGPHQGFGLVCGDVSGRLECLEIEGSFIGRLDEINDALRKAGLLEVWEAWLEGYVERSPSGGLHTLVRIEGEGALPGNTKIALGPNNETWIESRGEGGFVIVAPSGGEVHPSGKPWVRKLGCFDSIAYTTLDLWDAVIGVLSRFDESPAVADPPLLQQRAQYEGEGWIGEALNAYAPLQEVLLHHGWQYVRDEPLGQLWRRPGKQIGHSARINHAGRLINFSSSVPLPLGKRTFDALDVDLAYEIGHVPSLDERTARLRETRPASAAAASDTAPEDGHCSRNLPDEFWAMRPYLSHVFAAAIASRVSPDALWMSTKTMYAATIPWNYRLPHDGTFDYIGVMVGPSGSGKTRAKQTAINLLGPRFQTIPGIMIGLPPGTGEGMTEVYIKRDKDGTQSFRLRGAGFYVDEGTWLFDTAARSGNTTIQALKSAWSGELTGSLAGTVERNRFLPPRAVRFALLLGIQPGIAAQLMRADLTDGGLPQRICWSWSQHPHYPDDEPVHPGVLEVPCYEAGEHDAVAEILYCDEIKRMLSEQQRAAITGVGSVALNGHEAYAKLKSAAIHALMDGRDKVSLEDWQLAEIEWQTSETIRSAILASASQVASDQAKARGVANAHAQLAEYDVYLGQAALAIARKAKRANDLMTARDLTDVVTGKQKRFGVTKKEALQHAIALGYVVKVGTQYRQGRVTP